MPLISHNLGTWKRRFCRVSVHTYLCGCIWALLDVLVDCTCIKVVENQGIYDTNEAHYEGIHETGIMKVLQLLLFKFISLHPP